MLPEELLKSLREHASLYQLPNTIYVFRSEPEVDDTGGVINDFRNIGEHKARVIIRNIYENLEGGGITPNNEFTIIISVDADVMAEDRIYIKDDEVSNRYFEVVGTDKGASDGLFTTVDVEERTN